MGDPSVRTKERDQLQMETLERNLQGISENLLRIFNNYELLFNANTGSPIQYDNSALILYEIWILLIVASGFSTMLIGGGR